MSSSSPNPKLIGQMLGQYRVLSRINEGGAAVVYRAYQESMARYVAIKVLKLDLVDQDATFLQRFRQEARTVAQLQHPHILPVLDFGEADNLVYLVMVLLEGGTLRHYLRQHGALPLEQCAFLVAQIASALDRAHSRGILHRDLKPENILMDEDRNAYLTDFGIARMLESASRLTRAGMLLGTPQYMSPEQIKGLDEIDQRADVYSLGVMLYEMVTGTLPFAGNEAHVLFFQHLQEAPPPPRERNPQLTERVSRVLLRALQKNPDDRYPSAIDLAEAFVSALPNSPMITDEMEQRAAEVPIGTIIQADIPSHLTRTPQNLPARLAPARPASEADQYIIIENPNDPNIHVPMPNGYMHYLLRALEAIGGLQAMEVILRFAGLEELLDDYPPNNMKLSKRYTFKHFGDLNQAMLNYFGANGPGALQEAGKLLWRSLILEHPLHGLSNIAFRFMPLVAAYRLGLNRMADTWNGLWQDYEMNIKIIEKPDFFLWASHMCPSCAGKSCDRPLGGIFTGAFAEGGQLIKGKTMHVTEIACMAKGDPMGVWRIDKATDPDTAT